MDNNAFLKKMVEEAHKLGDTTATLESLTFKYKGYTIPYGYYKVLTDFGLFKPNGKASPQEILSLKNYDFKEAAERFSNVEKVRREEILQQFDNETVREEYRKSDLTTEELEAIVEQKRKEIADEVIEKRYGKKGESRLSVDVNTEARFSIEKAIGGKDVVVIEDNILEGLPKSEWVDAVKNAIIKFKPAIPIAGKLIKVTAVTGKEYVNSKDTKSYRLKRKTIYRDKLRAANNLDEIVLAATNYVNEDLKHKRKDNIKEFARGEVLMQIGKNKYKANVVVGFTSGQSMVLYDIVNFYKTEFTIRKKKVDAPKENQSSLKQETSPSNTIITKKTDLSIENDEKVEKKF